ncbi:hypothetical protein IVA80_10860 [Bradyrhizobium sp. 139]|uniref:hypothetical protein n=1 Tax=Bradyrhizobium sp. 139 TaxID=2782616 RepID=UPI001FFBA247|nr:hypothetical protein [Bradyrhizobium sp. 139]MCK1741350.1 hypothetical protein [Bradyrhizobium sp. 139]
MDIKLHFAIEKQTKGAVRFKEVNADGSDAFDPKIGTLYVRKSAMGGQLVEKLTLNVTAA